MVMIEKIGISTRGRFFDFLDKNFKNKKSLFIHEKGDGYEDDTLERCSGYNFFSISKTTANLEFKARDIIVKLISTQYKDEVLKLLESFEKENEDINCILRI